MFEEINQQINEQKMNNLPLSSLSLCLKPSDHPSKKRSYCNAFIGKSQLESEMTSRMRASSIKLTKLNKKVTFGAEQQG